MGEKCPGLGKGHLISDPSCLFWLLRKKSWLVLQNAWDGFQFSACRKELLMMKPSPWPATVPLFMKPQHQCCLMLFLRALSLVIPWRTLREQAVPSAQWVWLSPSSVWCQSGKGYLLCSQRGKDIPKLREAELRVYLTLRLPWWSSDSKSTCQCRRHGFDLWSGKILHAADQLNRRVPQLQSLCSVWARGPQLTETTRCNYWSPLT